MQQLIYKSRREISNNARNHKNTNRALLAMIQILQFNFNKMYKTQQKQKYLHGTLLRSFVFYIQDAIILTLSNK